MAGWPLIFCYSPFSSLLFQSGYGSIVYKIYFAALVNVLKKLVAYSVGLLMLILTPEDAYKPLRSDQLVFMSL